MSHRGAPLILPLPSASDTPLPLPLANRGSHGPAVPAFNVGPCMDVAAGCRQGRQGRPGEAWPFSGISSKQHTTPATRTEPAKLLPPQEPWGFASAASQEPTTGPGTTKPHSRSFPRSSDHQFWLPLPRCASGSLASVRQPVQEVALCLVSSCLPSPSYYCHCLLAGHPKLISSILSTLFHAAFFPCARPAPSNLSFLPSLDSQPPFVLRVKCGPCGLQIVDRRGLGPLLAFSLPSPYIPLF